MIKKVIAGASGATAYLLWAGQNAVIFAAETITIERPKVGGANAGPTTINSFINNLVSLAFIVAVILVFFFLVFGGIKWIISGGDQKKTEEARNMITAAIVGLAIVALAFALVKVLESFFNIAILERGLTLPSST